MSAIRCPRCQTVMPAGGDVGGSLVCSGCGARLRTRQASPGAAAAAGGSSGLPRNPNLTLPPGTPLPKIPRPPAAPASAPASAAPTPAPAPTAASTAALFPFASPAPEQGASLDTLLVEIRAIKELQEEIVALLRDRPVGPPAGPSFADSDPSPFDMVDEPPRSSPPPIRARRRKTVLLIDDDEATRNAAVAALEKAEVPVRVAADGNAGLAAIAAEKPDVIVLELDLGGSMAGKDMVNMIKATMEWVDVPILLYTRHPIENQKEARQIHGADEYVLKSAGAETLVGRVITVFRKGG